MRAKHQVKTLESSPATGPSRRLPDRSGLGVRWVLLAILAGALALLALWGPAARRGATPIASRTIVSEFQPNHSTRTGPMRTTPKAVRLAATPDELNNASVDEPSVDAAYLTGVAVVVSLMSLPWLFVFRAELRPGITFGFFVPG
jgi:hypothetical protein